MEKSSHEAALLAGIRSGRQLACWAQAVKVIELLAVILCHSVVGVCIMAVTIIDLIAGTHWLGKIRQQDRGKYDNRR